MGKIAEAGMETAIRELMEALTLDEKISMIHGAGFFRTAGVNRLGIPELKMSDGPMGVRNDFKNAEWVAIGNSDDYVTYLPSNSALAATWNRKLAYESGKVLGEEARGRGKDVILAPGINIKRSPLCGRNFEYMSEDPYLAGELAVPLIQGIQTADTAACVKHFAMNNQETERLWVNVEISERALREIYLPAFKKAVQEGNAYSLMGAYNRYKDEHCCESKVLLNGVLRTEWGYDGMVVSDWGGVHKTKEAAESGLDIEMSVTDNFDEYCMADPLKQAVEAGEIPESLIDSKVEHILKLMFRLHMLGGGERKSGCYNTPEHRSSVLDAARESVVLLKNDDQQLPLSPKSIRKLLVIGDNASRMHSNGGGSAEIKALYEISPLMGIKKRLGGNVQVDYVQGYFAHDLENAGSDINWQADSLENGGGYIAAAGEDEEITRRQAALRCEAVERAADSSYDAVIFIGGQNHQQDTEGHDRPDMRLPYAQDELIRELLGVRPELMVVMVSGSAVEMPWLSKVKTLVWHWYAGMEGGTALAEVLFGDINPSGRLPESFPITHTDCPAHCVGEFPGDNNVRYDEGIFVGYRYYDTKKKKELFPFGYGLSYTEFTFSDMVIMGNYPEIQVCVDVTNTGSRSGQEVVQLYVGKKDSAVERAAKELKGFEKISLEPGQTKNVVLTLDEEAFYYYNEEKHAFDVESGEYQIYIGKSVENICLEGKCTI
ncbi:MAG: beta-glucosidase [Coprococcus sp.]